MRKVFWLLLPLLFVLQFSCNRSSEKLQASKVEQVVTYAPTAAENSLLWEISGKDLATPSYLYGTIHMIGKDDYFLTDQTKKAFGESKKIVFEINMEDMTNPAAIFPLISKLMMPDGKTLKDLLSTEDYAFVKAKFAESGLPPFFMGMLEKVKPMFLTVMGGGDMAPGDIQSGKIKSYELEFMQMAQSSGKSMGGLETIEFQMSVFDSIPYEAQAEMLVESMRDTVGSSQFQEMVEMYKSQDIVKMMDSFESEEGGLEGYDDVLLWQRNRNWIPIMSQMMTEAPTFFAVGAGHLGGEEGVIALLRKKGYILKPLRDKAGS